MASAFGVTVVHGSLIATLTQLGYAIGLLLFVPLGDVIQPRKLTSLAICANAVALIACAVVARDSGTQLEVDAGLRVGERVILNPPVTLGDGSSVRPRSPGAGPTS